MTSKEEETGSLSHCRKHSNASMNKMIYHSLNNYTAWKQEKLLAAHTMQLEWKSAAKLQQTTAISRDKKAANNWWSVWDRKHHSFP